MHGLTNLKIRIYGFHISPTGTGLTSKPNFMKICQLIRNLKWELKYAYTQNTDLPMILSL